MPELGSQVWKRPAVMEQIEGIRYGVESHAVWSNLSVTVGQASCATPSTLSDEVDCSRLVVVLEQQGGRVVIGPHHSRRPIPTHDTAFQMSLGPPGARQWGFFRQPMAHLRCIALMFDLASFEEQLGSSAAAGGLCPRYMFFDPHVLEIVRHIEVECSESRPASTLYADTLSLTLAHRLLQLEHRPGEGRACYLSPRERQQVTDCIRARLAENIRLGELAALVHMSPSHFCRAFKASVGVPPHAWHLRERIRLAQRLLRNGAPVAQVAISTGFVDQAHFSRVFTRLSGLPPRSWRRAHTH